MSFVSVTAIARALGIQDDVQTWTVMLVLLKKTAAEASRCGEVRLKGSRLR